MVFHRNRVEMLVQVVSLVWVPGLYFENDCSVPECQQYLFGAGLLFVFLFLPAFLFTDGLGEIFFSSSNISVLEGVLPYVGFLYYPPL